MQGCAPTGSEIVVDGRLHQRMCAGRESRGPVTHPPDVDGERDRSRNAVAVFLVERLSEDGLDRSVEFLQRARILAAQVDLEPCRLRY